MKKKKKKRVVFMVPWTHTKTRAEKNSGGIQKPGGEDFFSAKPQRAFPFFLPLFYDLLPDCNCLIWSEDKIIALLAPFLLLGQKRSAALGPD